MRKSNLQKRCGRCWHKLTFTHMYKSQSHNITLQYNSLDCTYHFDMFTNRWTWGQWYMRSNDWVSSCFKWPSLKIHWPNMTLAVYQYFLLVSQVQISPLQNQCVYCCVWNARYPLNYAEAHEPQADPWGLNSCFNTDGWWTNICENNIQNKQTKKTTTNTWQVTWHPAIHPTTWLLRLHLNMSFNGKHIN